MRHSNHFGLPPSNGSDDRYAANINIGSGKAGNMDTVQVMKKLARWRCSDIRVRELALSICQGNGIDSHDYLSECAAIGTFVQQRMRYVRDIEGMEQVQDPVIMVQDIQLGRAAGDCDDMALLIACLLLSIGASPYFKTVRYGATSGPYHHIYTVAYEANYRQAKQRIVMDAIIKDKPIGYEVKSTSGDEYKV